MTVIFCYYVTCPIWAPIYIICTCLTEQTTDQEREPLLPNNVTVQTGNSDNSNSSEITANETNSQNLVCPVCYSNIFESERHQIVFVPCGHFCCNICSPRVNDCPLCREKSV